MKLNVGCGANTWGDVRLDVVRDYWLTKGKSAVNIIADAQHMPFRDKCFDELRLHHVLEHIPNWKKALSECCRVAGKLSIIIPIDSYIPRLEWHHIPPFLYSLPTLGYFRYLLQIPRRTREHLWQFDINKLTSTLRTLGLSNIHTQVIYDPLFIASGQKGKPFVRLFQRFKKPSEWRIIAF